MQSYSHLLAEGDTLANLASRQQETVSALRLFNPQLARYPASAPMPAGVTIQLPVGSWVLLPPQRGVGGLAELWGGYGWGWLLSAFGQQIGLMTVLPAPLSIRQRLLASKGEVLAVARRCGASNLRLFGSVALGLEHDGSDLDLLVDLEPQQSLLAMIGLRQELESLLGCAVDVAEAESLHPLIRAEVLGQAVPLWTKTRCIWRAGSKINADQWPH
jgi:uncharacterized protein